MWETGQKELRIIDILEPVLSSGRLIMDEETINEDVRHLQRYAIQDRSSYSLFYQMARITRDKNSLIHDDRLDALAGSVRYWVEMLRMDDEKSRAATQKEAYKKLMQNPLGNGRPVKGFATMRGTGSALTSLDRRKQMR